MKTIKKSLLIIFTLILISPILLANSVEDDGGIVYDIQYVGHTNNPDGTSTWCYIVTSYTGPAISHWSLDIITDCLTEYNIVEITENGVSLGEKELWWDIPAGNPVLKFDKEYADYEVRTVCITFNVGYSIGNVNYHVVGGGQEATDTIEGPVCPSVVVPETPWGTLGSAMAVMVALAIYGYRKIM
jgi:hypothetical protein